MTITYLDPLTKETQAVAALPCVQACDSATIEDQRMCAPCGARTIIQRAKETKT